MEYGPVISSDCKSGPGEILAPDTDIEQQVKGIEYAKHGILLSVCDGIVMELKSL